MPISIPQVKEIRETAQRTGPDKWPFDFIFNFELYPAIKSIRRALVALMNTGAYVKVQDEGVELPQEISLDFVGPGVVATDDAPNNRTTVTVSDGVLAPVASIAAGGTRLIDIDTTSLADGMMVYVNTVEDLFVFDASSTATADSITIATPVTGPGRWFRHNLGNIKWRLQTTWYIDFVTLGNDEADGATASTPLKHHGELVRRLGRGPVPTSIDVYLLSNTTASDMVFIQGLDFSPTALLRYHGVPTVAYSGTVSAVTALNSATQTAPTITDAGMTDFATHIGRRIRLTGGANAGAVGWLTKRISATEARTSQLGINDETAVPYEPTVTLVTPAVNDTYVIETLPTLSTMEFDCAKTQSSAGGTVLLFDSLKAGWAAGSRFCSHMASFSATKCEWNNRLIFGRSMQWSLCRMNGDEAYAFGAAVMRACYLRDQFTLFQNATLEARDQCVVQGGKAFVNVGRNCFAEIFNNSSFDAVTDGIVVDVHGGVKFSGLFWGGNNAQAGVRVYAGGYGQYVTKPTCIGLVTDTVIGGTNTAYGAIPFIEPANNAALVLRA